MAGSKIKCPHCDECFYGKQKSLKCKQCRKRYHFQCLKVTIEEYQIYLKANNFKCSSCLGKAIINEDTPIKYSGVVSGEDSDVDGDSNSNFDINDCQKPGSLFTDKLSLDSLQRDIRTCIEEAVSEIIRGFHLELSSVKAELQLLREENIALKDVVMKSNLRQSQSVDVSTLVCSPVADSAPSAGPSQSYSDLSTQDQNRFASANNNNNNKNNTSKTSFKFVDSSFPNLRANPLVKNSSDTVNGNVLSNDVNVGQPQGITENPWLQQRSKKRNRALLPENVNENTISKKKKESAPKFSLGLANVGTNLVRPRVKSLFVSRFNPSVTVDDVKGLIVVNDFKHLKCERLKTKHNSYNSFYIEVLASDFDALRSPDRWPSGILLAPFYGVLKKETIYSKCGPAEDGLNNKSDG